MRRPTIVILAAGMGSRLGRPHPKALTPISADDTILSRQLYIFRSFALPIIIVVGFKKELIMEADTRALYAYNADFDTTNTSKSLLCGLHHLDNSDVLWINGDVVFDSGIVERMLSGQGSLVAVNDAAVGREEVKYRLDPEGRISKISKSIDAPSGEALGINYLEARHLGCFKQMLAAVGDNDYFEKAMERLIDEHGPVFRPLRVPKDSCIEVDFEVDLNRAKEMVVTLNGQNGR